MPTQSFQNSDFSRHVAAARLYPMPTQKAAISEARAMGVMIRREAADAGPARGFEVYPVGSPEMAAYAECPAEALFWADAFAHDMQANRLSLLGRPTLRSVAESLASRAAKAAGLNAGDVAARIDETESGLFAVFSGPWACEYRARVDPKQPLAQLATRLAPAAEAAADDIAAHAREACDTCGGEPPIQVARGVVCSCPDCGPHAPMPRSLSERVAERREAEAEEARRHAGPAPTLESLASGPRGDDDTSHLTGGAARKARSLSAAANPDAPRPRRRIARTRSELIREAERAAEAGDSLAAELAGLSLAVVDGPRASGAFPLYAFRDGFAHDADSLDALAYGSATGGYL